jgi:2-C-methyl-D-erythritol 4-phosphate cytidylyltransferase
LTDAVAVILAAGAGVRLGEETPKAFVPLAGTTMLALAAGAAERCPEVRSIVVVVPSGWERRAESLLPSAREPTMVTGGASRQESVYRALQALRTGTDAVVCHDAARPFASPELFSRVLAELAGADGAIPVLPVADTVKRVQEGMIVGTEARENLGLAQTPQAFLAEALREAHAAARARAVAATDDAALLERVGRRVRAVPGEPDNFKVTTPEDLARAERILAARGVEREVRHDRRSGWRRPGSFEAAGG